MVEKEKSSDKRYQSAKAKVEKATRGFEGIQTVSAQEVENLQRDGKEVLLVDVRTEDEMKVSMLRGAISREAFEGSRLGEPVRTGAKFQGSSSSREGENGDVVVVPYCTVGYRSGMYAKKLLDLGYPAVLNSEGVVLWTHDVGGGFVAPEEIGGEGKCAEGHDDCSEKQPTSVPGNDAGSGSLERKDDDTAEVKRVHVYASPWDYAHGDFETVKFTPRGCWVAPCKMALWGQKFGLINEAHLPQGC